jgi:serine acetyltransferase
MIRELLHSLKVDARFYAALAANGRKPTKRQVLITVLGNRGLWFLTFHRVAYACQSSPRRRNPAWWLLRFAQPAGRYLGAVLCKSEILSDCAITGPVYLSSKGLYVFGAQHVGAGSVIHHRVTFGMAATIGKPERPTIGADVWIGPDCVIAGKLHVGDGATILPGTYLTSSVPPRSVVRGNPARVMLESFDNAALRSSLEIVTELPALHNSG